MTELEISQQIERCYKTCERLHKEELESKLKGWANLIFNLAEGKMISILEATIEIIKEVKKEDNNAYSVMHILAAAYALINL